MYYSVVCCTVYEPNSARFISFGHVTAVVDLSDRSSDQFHQ
jgi:hypothetical protein